MPTNTAPKNPPVQLNHDAAPVAPAQARMRVSSATASIAATDEVARPGPPRRAELCTEIGVEHLLQRHADAGGNDQQIGQESSHDEAGSGEVAVTAAPARQASILESATV